MSEIKRDGLGEYVDTPKVMDDPVTKALDTLKRWSCPKHHNFIMGSDGVRRCKVSGCDWEMKVLDMTGYSRDELLNMRARLCVDGGGRTEFDQRVIQVINEELLHREAPGIALDARARSLNIVNQYAPLFGGGAQREEVRAAIQQHIELAVREVRCGDEGAPASAPGLNTSGITAPAHIPAREGRAAANAPIIGDDLDLDAIYEAGFGPEHMLNRLVEALRAAQAEIERLRALVKHQEGEPT